MAATAEFYKNTEIFITGGSGVLGKAAIEKLFRSCNVKKIYILVRSKKNVPPEDRLREIKNSKIFRVLKELKPNELDKLIAIPGDITHDYLGVSEEHKSLMKNISIFINSAASTQFNLPIRKSIECNLKSTREALRLAETFKNLKLFLHISTFFCNPSIAHLEDKVYPPVFDWKTALKMLDSEYDQMEPVFNAIENKIIDEFPNTYVFTKHLAEQLVNDNRHKLPVALFRPSIVLPTLLEPEPGFTETKVGVMGLLTVWGTGLIQVLLCKPKMILDLMPLDASTNYMLIFLAKTAGLEREKFSEKTPVGTVTSTGILVDNLATVGNILSRLVLKNPLEKAIWIPNVKLTSCSFIYWIYTIFLQVLPALIGDAVLKIFRQKPFLMKIQRKIYFSASALRYFISKQFPTDCTTNLQEMDETTKGTEFDVTFFTTCCDGEERLTLSLEVMMKGCRKFLLNEDDSSLERCRKILKVKMAIYNVIRVYALYVVGSLILRRILS